MFVLVGEHLFLCKIYVFREREIEVEQQARSRLGTAVVPRHRKQHFLKFFWDMNIYVLCQSIYQNQIYPGVRSGNSTATTSASLHDARPLAPVTTTACSTTWTHTASSWTAAFAASTTARFIRFYYIVQTHLNLIHHFRKCSLLYYKHVKHTKTYDYKTQMAAPR